MLNTFNNRSASWKWRAGIDDGSLSLYCRVMEGDQSGIKIRIGISSCLLGEKVRYDGGHKLDTLITEALGGYFEWVSVCPEMEIGLGVPRETLRLVAHAEGTRMIATQSGFDYTQTMMKWAAKQLRELANQDLHGYILKKGSPSCGMERVRVYSQAGMAERNGRGIFASALMSKFPLMPVEEEGRLHDASIRENFVERVFALHRWKTFVKSKPRAGDLMRFHARHKLTLSSHCDRGYRQLGRLVAGGKQWSSLLLEEYGRVFMETLNARATTRKHANVLYHILGFLKEELDAGDKAEMVGLIESYRKGRVPLAAPLILLGRHLRHHPVPWITEQTYLNPYPAELMLRNHV